MTIDDIERLVRRLEASDITAFDVSDEATSLTLRLRPGPAGRGQGELASSALAEATPPAAGEAVRTRAIGVLRLRHPSSEPESEPAYPRAVRAGDIVAYLEAGSCLRPVVAEADGTIGAPLQADGSLVGYATPLFPFL